MEGYPNPLLRHIKPIIGITLGVIVIVVLITFFINNAIAFITVNGAPSGTKTTTSVIKGTTATKIGGTGIVIVPRGSEQLLVAANESVKTIVNVSVPWYGFMAKTVDLKPSKDATKVAFAAPGELCATYNPELDHVLRYDCAKPSVLYKYQTPDTGTWGDQDVADMAYIDNQILPPYRGGVIGIAQGTEQKYQAGQQHVEEPLALVANISGASLSLKIPSGISSDTLSGLRVITDTTDTKNTRFILIDKFGTIYLGTPSEDNKSVQYKTVSAPDSYSYKYNQTACTITGNTAQCHRGRNTAAIIDGDTASTKATIETLSFSDDSVSSMEVKNSPTVSTLYLAGDRIYGLDDKDVYAFDKSGDTYTARIVMKNVSSVASDKNTLYFTYGGAVFGYDKATDSAHELFQSSNIAVLGIYPVDGKLFAFGTTKNGDTTVYAYQLSAADHKVGAKRLIDVLPLADNAITDLPINDFVGSRIFLQPSTDTTSDEDIKNNFVNILSTAGVDIDANTIQIDR